MKSLLISSLAESDTPNLQRAKTHDEVGDVIDTLCDMSDSIEESMADSARAIKAVQSTIDDINVMAI